MAGAVEEWLGADQPPLSPAGGSATWKRGERTGAYSFGGRDCRWRLWEDREPESPRERCGSARRALDELDESDLGFDCTRGSGRDSPPLS